MEDHGTRNGSCRERGERERQLLRRLISVLRASLQCSVYNIDETFRQLGPNRVEQGSRARRVLGPPRGRCLDVAESRLQHGSEPLLPVLRELDDVVRPSAKPITAMTLITTISCSLCRRVARPAGLSGSRRSSGASQSAPSAGTVASSFERSKGTGLGRAPGKEPLPTRQGGNHAQTQPLDGCRGCGLVLLAHARQPRPRPSSCPCRAGSRARRACLWKVRTTSRSPFMASRLEGRRCSRRRRSLSSRAASSCLPGEQEALDLRCSATRPTSGSSEHRRDEVMEPRFRLGSVPWSGWAEYCSEATLVGGQAPSDFAPATHQHAWSTLTGIPADIDDGDNDALGALGCSNGQTVQRSDGTWGCVARLRQALRPCHERLVHRPRRCPDRACGRRSGGAHGTGTQGQVAMFNGPEGSVRRTCTTTAATSASGHEPAARLHVNGDIRWGQACSRGRWGLIELGDSTVSGTTPLVDFHFGAGAAEDYSVRLINSARVCSRSMLQPVGGYCGSRAMQRART